MSEVFVAGTRSFAAEAIGWASDAGLEVIGLLGEGTEVHGLSLRPLEEVVPGGRVVIGTGEHDGREELFECLSSAGWTVVSLVHPSAVVASNVVVGAGAVIGPLAVLGACVRVGAGVLIGRGALVGHHTVLEAFATLGPGANVGGNTVIAGGAHVALGALVRDHVTIGAGARVAMGAVVVGDVADGVTVRGLPARSV